MGVSIFPNRPNLLHGGFPPAAEFADTSCDQTACWEQLHLCARRTRRFEAFVNRLTTQEGSP
jgi:hypothetical protein